MVLLNPAVTVVVHPIDTEAHPTVPAGWRWSIQVGGSPPADLQHCANAGWCPTEAEARLEGEMLGVTVRDAVGMMFGIHVFCQVITLDHDPIPAEQDHIHA